MDNSVTPDASDLTGRVRAFMAQPGDDAAFNRLALEVFAFQFANVPIYRQFCEKRTASPAAIQSWSQIPALPVAAFKEHAVSSLPENERSRVFDSSGTTGHLPSRHFHNAASLSLYEASLLPWFERHFPGAGAMFLFLTPAPEDAPHSSLIHMFKTICEKLGGPGSLYAGRLEVDGSWGLDFNLIDSALGHAAAGKRPVTACGTAFSFVHWLDVLAAAKVRLRLPAGSRILETGGYKGRSRVMAKAELRRLMIQHLGVPDSNIVTEYGMCELSSQAYGGPSGVLQFPPWARTQIISPETGRAAAAGETGLLRVFDLANIHSVMAIQTEDLAASRGEGFELLGRIEAAEPRGCSLLAATEP